MFGRVKVAPAAVAFRPAPPSSHLNSVATVETPRINNTSTFTDRLYSSLTDFSHSPLSPVLTLMGTLTADCPRLDGHCDHKLATSCRLTSTLNCCACADERAHSLTYRVYIDGIGFVQRGTRWQGYCWFCRGNGTPFKKNMPNIKQLTVFRILDQPPSRHRTSSRDFSNPHTRNTRAEGVSGKMVRVSPGLSACKAS